MSNTLQAACREAGGAKPKVLINLSLNGIKVADLKSKVLNSCAPGFVTTVENVLSNLFLSHVQITNFSSRFGQSMYLYLD